MVDPLFPKNPICKCEVGYKKTKKGKCVGEFIRVYFSIFCSVIAYFGAYLTLLHSVIAGIHESAFSYLEIVHSAL